MSIWTLLILAITFLLMMTVGQTIPALLQGLAVNFP